VVSIRVWRRLFIARVPEEIEMKELEKTETKDGRSGKKGTDDPWMAQFPKDDWFREITPQRKTHTSKRWRISLSHPQIVS
jgi:hypothetical protein